MLVQSSSNSRATSQFGCAVEVREVGDDRQHGGARKAERLEVLAVELRVAEREIAAIGVGAQLAAAAEALPRQRPVHADEILGRRDVVIDERHPIGQRVRGARGLRAEREMVQQQVVGMAGVDQLAVVARQRLEPVVGGLDEDLRFVAGAAQHALDAEHLVADRVAVAERREHLVDRGSRRASRRRPARQPGERPPAAGRQILRGAGRTSRAADRSAGGAGGSFFSRSNMSRYFRSITGQS